MVKRGRALHPMESPLCKIGYSIHPFKRLECRAKHHNSNQLMNATEAMFMRRYGNTFLIHQLLLFTCWEKIQPWFWEIVMTHAMQGYADKGTGFRHCPAGQSNIISMYRTGSHEDAFWARREVTKQRNIINSVRMKKDAERKRLREREIKTARKLDRDVSEHDELSTLLDQLKLSIDEAPEDVEHLQ